MVWAAVLVMVLNDHWLKHAAWMPWLLKGKVSDFAGMAFFPLVLQAVVELGWSLTGRPWKPSRRLLVGCAVVCGVFFAGIQVWEPLARVWTLGLGLLQWPVHGARAALSGDTLPSVVPVAHVSDLTDVVAVPMVGVAVWTGWRRARPTGGEDGHCDGNQTPDGP